MKFMGVIGGALAALAMLSGMAQAASPVWIGVLSSRADMVSGGDALIEIRANAGAYKSAIKLSVNGVDASDKVAIGPNGTFRALITGLKNGDNIVTAKLDMEIHKGQATIKLRNYPGVGPIFSGPHLKPYECRTLESGLGEPLDENCSAKTRIDYFYRAADNSFKPLLDPIAGRPADLKMTTTIDGRLVPYIVRVESGTINRTIYRIAILDDPKPGATGAWRPSQGWNGRLAVSFGGGSGANYNQGVNQVTAPLNDLYLSRGFAMLVATELVNQLHSNIVLQGESLMMLKEHFIETYGVPKWTVGTGGSGGAIQQLGIAQNYPGLLDGIQPSASFPDSSLHTADCGVLQSYWKKADAKVWTAEKKAAVDGFTPGTCAAWERSFVPVSMAINKPGCGLKNEALIYDPVTNPKGARCAIQDMRANIYGRDKNGYGRKAIDNVGLQYGLAGLNAGKISVDEFLDLNEKVGGNDLDGNFVSARSVGDPIAIRAAYEAGFINAGGGGLATTPIIHYRSYTDLIGDIHSRERDLSIRARLIKSNGDADNEVIWVAPMAPRSAPGQPAPAAGPTVNLAPLALDAMTKWLDALAADQTPLTHAKVVRHKPAEAEDAYWKDGKKTAETANFDGDTGYNRAFPMHSEPRLVAGAPLANDVLKCQLKPVKMSDYKVAFTAEQEAKLRAIFPTGVCDFSKPGMYQAKWKGPYQRY